MAKTVRDIRYTQYVVPPRVFSTGLSRVILGTIASSLVRNIVDEKINILMVDDQPGKLLSYEAMLGELGENLIKAIWEWKPWNTY